MRSQQIVLSVSFMGLLIANSAFATPVVSADSETHAVMKRALSEPRLTHWLYNYDGQMMRAGRDLQVANLIETDPQMHAVMQDVLAQVQPSVLFQELTLDMSAARSSVDNDAKNPIRQIVQEMALAEDFSPEAVKNVQLWTTIGSVNAYTFSPLHDRLNVVVYKELLDMMSPDDMKAVFAHELGHIKMKHILSGMMLEAVFHATGKLLVEDPAQRLALQSATRSGASELFKRAIDFEGPVADALVNTINKHSELAGEALATKMTPLQLVSVVSKLQVALGVTPNFEVVQGQIKRNAGDDSDPIAAKRFKEATKSLTRDQERTADRWAAVAAGPERLASSMAKLAGGSSTLATSILRQARQLLTKADVLGVDLKTLDNSDHPTPVVRVAAAIQFSATRNFKIMKNPFLKAMDQYVKLQLDIVAIQKALAGNASEQVDADRMMSDRATYKLFAKNLSAAIVREVVNEVTAQTSSEKMEALLKVLDAGVKDYTVEDTFKKMPLFAELSQALSALPSQSTAGALLAELSARLPEDSLQTSFGTLRSTLKTQVKTCQAVFH